MEDDCQDEFVVPNWTLNPHAKNYFCSILTQFYALLLIVLCAVLELSEEIASNHWLAEMAFHILMYGIGLIILILCYFLLIYPCFYNFLLAYLQKKQFFLNFQPFAVADYNKTQVASLYLRFGTLLFGSITIVQFGLETFFSLANCEEKFPSIVNLIFAGLFTFMQTHFLFSHSMINLNKIKNLASFGMMHLVAVNVWTWIRFVLIKHSSKADKITKKLSKVNKAFNSTVSFTDQTTTFMSTTTVDEIVEKVYVRKLFSFDHFGDISTVFTTCIIEYSIVGAAIMFVIWKNLDFHHESLSKKKKQINTEDCSSSTGGFFSGILLMIFALISACVYVYFYKQEDSSKDAILVFQLSDIVLFSFALIGSVLGIYRMRLLQFTHVESNSTALLDEILLFVGLTGELIHSSSAIVCFIISQENGPEKMEIQIIFVLVIRITQVLLQSLFILMATRLGCLNRKTSKKQPGKQLVTLLLIANVALFFFHSLEGMEAIFGNAIENETTKPFSTLVSIVAPLIVFFRFHSSVCLDEIRKHCYKSHKSQTNSLSTSESCDSSNTIEDLSSGLIVNMSFSSDEANISRQHIYHI